MDISDSIIGAESSGNRNAKAQTSSALGPGQFIDGTWLDLIKRYRPDLAQGKTRAEVLAMRTDPELSKDMTRAYEAENSAGLRRAGLPVTPGTIYLTHFAGQGGGIKLLKADPHAPVESILDAKAIAANPFLKGMTAADVIAWADRRITAARPRKLTAGPQPAQQNPDVSPGGDVRRAQLFPQRAAPVPYLTQTQGVGPMPSAAGTSPSLQNLDQTITAQRLLDKGAFNSSQSTPDPEARYLVRVPSLANSAAAGGAPMLPSNAAPSVAPTSFDDRFGNWPSSSQASAPMRPTTASPDGQPSPDGSNTSFGIYKYPTENQLGFDPGALSASPMGAASPDARYLVRVPSPQTDASLPYQPQPNGPTGPDLAIPAPIWGFPDQSKDDNGGGNDWLLQLLGSIGLR
jgi:hypothetical protein